MLNGREGNASIEKTDKTVEPAEKNESDVVPESNSDKDTEVGGNANGEKEATPQQEIITVQNDIDRIEQRILLLRKSDAETQRQKDEQYRNLGIESETTTAKGNDAAVELLEEQKLLLTEHRAKWLEDFGIEKIPEGLVIETKNGHFETRINPLDIAEEISEVESSKNKEKKEKEALVERKQILENWKARAIKKFQAFLESSWQSVDAINLELAVHILGIKIPKAIDKIGEGFAKGEVDDLPSNIWFSFSANSFIDRLLDKPNQIRGMELTFDKEKINMAGETELVTKEEKEIQKDDNEQDEGDLTPQEATSEN
ncbi:MAG: hypothetical protein WCP14_00360 [bacterium]